VENPPALSHDDPEDCQGAIMTDQTRMMTYAEAAGLLGIKVDSVMRRARNRKWHKELGNDGLARIAVPVSIIPPDDPPAFPADDPPEPPKDDPAISARIASLETEVRMLRENMVDLRADRDAWRDQAQARRRWWPFS
jgi:alkylation response protein AidB-like acyl-CoA dehydrogenase